MIAELIPSASSNGRSACDNDGLVDPNSAATTPKSSSNLRGIPYAFLDRFAGAVKAIFRSRRFLKND